MVAGHFATALIPIGRAPRMPLWLPFLAAMLPDTLYFLLAFYGVERPLPVGYWTTALQDMQASMPYSHSLLSVLVQMAAVAVLGWAVMRERRAAVWCAGLVGFHFVSDLLAGFQHEAAGVGSFEMGFNLYNRAPLTAMAIEAGVSAICVTWFVRNRRVAGAPLSIRSLVGLYAVLVGGSFLLLPIASRPLARFVD